MRVPLADGTLDGVQPLPSGRILYGMNSLLGPTELYTTSRAGGDVKRVTHRLGWATSEDPDKIEFELMEVIPRDRWTQSCHQLIFHGRTICIAKNPKCKACPVTKLCPKIGVD